MKKAFLAFFAVVSTLLADELEPPRFYCSCREESVRCPVDVDLALDDFRGIYSGSWQNAFGASANFQEQAFITLALSRQTPNASGWNAGVAYDWILNHNFGIFAVNPYFDQVRAQFGYVIKGGNEIDAWGTYGIPTVKEESQNLHMTLANNSNFMADTNQNF